jgi:hypothetical protein
VVCEISSQRCSLHVRKSYPDFEILDSRSGMAVYGLVYMCQSFGNVCCFHLQGTHHVEYGSSELFGNVVTVSLYQSTRRRIPEDFAIFEGVREVLKI